MKKTRAGFTLVELMVVISVIAVLATIVYANLGKANPKARDAERQADLRNLQTAIEQYKQKNGRYPVMGTDTDGDTFSSEKDGMAAYVVGLAPTFMTVLPKDTSRGSNLGYTYVSNAEGSSYKIMAVGTVESETVTAAHPMKSCDTSAANICAVSGVCAPSDARYQKTYALWGGYADGINDAAVKTATAAVICK